MKKNFVVEILHATKKLVSPRGDIEDLNSGTIKARLITATETLTSEKDLKVVGEDGTATIRDLDVTDTADVENRLTVKNDTKTKNLEVAPDEKGEGGNATIHNAIIKSLDNASQAWATDAPWNPKKDKPQDRGIPRDLVTDAQESETDNHPNMSTAGVSTKIARADHIHRIPNSIKNPYMLKIKGVNVGEGTVIHAYDGGPCNNGDAEIESGTNNRTGHMLLQIDYNFTGAAKKNHASDTAVFGVGNDSLYGHTMLYDMNFSTYDRNNDSANETIIAEARNYDVNQGTALTPKALANYAKYINEYMDNNFIGKPKNPNETVTCDGNFLFTGNITIEGELHTRRIRVKDSGYIDGTLEDEVGGSSDNTIKIYGVRTNSIGKIQFGQTDNNTILRSSNDGHLYIEHSDKDYISKLADFEIEKIITHNAPASSRYWYPSKEGLYRIYLVGGGGMGAGAFVKPKNFIVGKDESPLSVIEGGRGINLGYGCGDVYPGMGGGGGTIVEINLETKNAVAADDDTTPLEYPNAYYRKAAPSNTSVAHCEGMISITSKNDDGTYNGSFSAIRVTVGQFMCVPDVFTDAGIIGGSVDATFSGVSGSDLCITENTEGEGESAVTTYEVTGGYMVVYNTTINLVDCQMVGGGTISSADYTLPNVQFDEVLVSVYEEDDSEEDDSGDSDKDDEISEDENACAEFVFLTCPRKKCGISGNNVTIINNGSSVVRGVGVVGLSAVGKIIDKVGSGTMTGANALNIFKGFHTGLSTEGEPSPHEKKVSELKKKEIDAIAGHGMDAHNSFTPNKTHPSTVVTNYSEGGTCWMYNKKAYSDSANYYHGGSKVYMGQSIDDSLLLDYATDSANYKNASFKLNAGWWNRACCPGGNGGCPGNVIWSGSGGNSSNGILKGKGSAGGAASASGYNYMTTTKNTIKAIGGSGASLSLQEFDGYSGSQKDSHDYKLWYPAPAKSKMAGTGYCGGGNGGGGAAIRNTSKTKSISSRAIKENANTTYNRTYPIAVILYLGKRK